MKFIHTTKKLISYPMYFLKIIERECLKKAQNKYVILMYHKIIKKDKKNCFLQDGMSVDPDTFNLHIKFLKKHFNIIPLECTGDIYNMISKNDINKPYCVLTFDDGWKDFYINAFPVLQKYNASATVFLPTDYIDTTKQFWTDQLAIILYELNKKIDRKVFKKVFNQNNNIISLIENSSGSIKSQYENSAKVLKTVPIGEINQILYEIAKRWQINIENKERSFLTWDEIKKMYNSGIIKFGSHTKSHNILTTVTEDLIREELVHSREQLIEKRVIDPSFIPFAYPNGNYNRRIAKIVEETGFDLAVTTKKGWNIVEETRDDIYELKRIGIHQDMASTNAMFCCRIHGIF